MFKPEKLSLILKPSKEPDLFMSPNSVDFSTWTMHTRLPFQPENRNKDF